MKERFKIEYIAGEEYPYRLYEIEKGNFWFKRYKKVLAYRDEETLMKDLEHMKQFPKLL